MESAIAINLFVRGPRRWTIPLSPVDSLNSRYVANDLNQWSASNTAFEHLSNVASRFGGQVADTLHYSRPY